MIAGALGIGAVLFVVLRRRQPGAAVTIPVAPSVPGAGAVATAEPIVLPTLTTETGDTAEGLAEFLAGIREKLAPPDFSSLLNPTEIAPNFPAVTSLAPPAPAQPVMETETDTPSWRERIQESVMAPLVERAAVVVSAEPPSPVVAQVQAHVAQEVAAATAPGATVRDIMAASFATRLARSFVR